LSFRDVVKFSSLSPVPYTL